MARHKTPPAPIGDANDPRGMLVLLNKFLEALAVKNYSPRTVALREYYIKHFIRWCSERGLARPQEITKPILERFQRWLFHYRKADGNPMTFRAQSQYLIALRSWFQWLARNNYILFNPAGDLELPRGECHLPKFVLTAAEADRVINQPNLATVCGLRDRAILETFYSTGMRRKELAELKIYDIDRSRGTVMIRQGKGKQDRVVPIGDRALAWIDRYVQEARPRLLIGDLAGETLFLTEYGNPFTPNRLTALVRAYVKSADLGKQGSCHLFRHTMATLMLENGSDVRFVQAMLGHRRLDTTMLYTHVSIQKLKDIHTATHPARLKRKTNPDATPSQEE